LGETSSDFETILLASFDFVLLELAQLDLISALRKQGSFVFSSDTPSNGISNFSTRTIAGLSAPLYPSAIRELVVPAWGLPNGKLDRTSDQEFTDLWLANGTSYTGRPRIWRLYPSEQQLQTWPVADTDNETATCLFEYTAPPTTLAAGAAITEVLMEDLPPLLTGLYRHGLKFQDETIRDLQMAEAMWALGIAAMKTRQMRRQFTGRDVQIKYRDI